MAGQVAPVGFVRAQNCSNYAASWRLPWADHGFLSLPYYQRIASNLEAGKVQLMFFDDRRAMPEIFEGSHAESVRSGVQVVKLDPLVVLSGLRENLGLSSCRQA